MSWRAPRGVRGPVGIAFSLVSPLMGSPFHPGEAGLEGLDGGAGLLGRGRGERCRTGGLPKRRLLETGGLDIGGGLPAGGFRAPGSEPEIVAPATAFEVLSAARGALVEEGTLEEKQGGKFLPGEALPGCEADPSTRLRAGPAARLSEGPAGD